MFNRCVCLSFKHGGVQGQNFYYDPNDYCLETKMDENGNFLEWEMFVCEPILKTGSDLKFY